MEEPSLVDRLTEGYSKLYPGLSHAEIQKAITEKLRGGVFEQVDWDEVGEDVAKELERTAYGEDDFERHSGVSPYGLMVMSQRDDRVCGPCLGHDGKQYTLPEAKKNPPLPHAGCKNSECRCGYLPIMDKEKFEEMQGEEPDLSHLRE